jgi:hypothetical protein
MTLSKKRKNTDDLRTSNRLLEKTQSLCPNNYNVTKTVRSNERKIHDLNRSDYGFFGFAGGKQTPFGLSFGALKQQKIGWYVSARANVNLFKGESSSKYEFPDEYTITKIIDNKTHYLTGRDEPKIGALNLSIGINKRIFFPVWVYAGAGFAYTKDVKIFSEITLPGKQPIPPITLSMSPHWRPNIDAGIMIPLSVFQLSCGVRTTFKETFFTFGAGFAF